MACKCTRTVGSENKQVQANLSSLSRLMQFSRNILTSENGIPLRLSEGRTKLLQGQTITKCLCCAFESQSEQEVHLKQAKRWQEVRLRLFPSSPSVVSWSRAAQRKAKQFLLSPHFLRPLLCFECESRKPQYMQNLLVRSAPTLILPPYFCATCRCEPRHF